MKTFIIASLLACFTGGPVLLHGDEATRLAIRDELKQLAVQNERFLALQELEAKSQKGWATVAKIGAHACSFDAFVGLFLFILNPPHIQIKSRLCCFITSHAAIFLPLAGSYGLHALAEHVIAPKKFKNKLKTFFETWDKKSTYYNFKHKLSYMLRAFMEKHHATWAKLKDESKEKADTYLHDLSRELRTCARSFKKTGFWNSLVGKQTIIEGAILAGGIIMRRIYAAKIGLT